MIAEDLEAQYNTALAEEVARVEEEMTEKVNQYLDYAVNQWMEQNQVAIEHSLRTEITESFISQLRALFEQNYITVPEQQFDVVEQMQSDLEEMKSRLDAVLEENMTLKNQLSESTRAKIIAAVAEGLAATQVEKLTSLAEGVDYDSAENFRKKLEIVKENYFPVDKKGAAAQSLLEEVEEQQDSPQPAPANSPVALYAKAISRTVKK